MRIPEIVPLESRAHNQNRQVHGRHAVNPDAVGYSKRRSHLAVAAVKRAFAIQSYRSQVIEDIASDTLLSGTPPEHAVIISVHGDDKIVNQVITNISGYGQDSAEAEAEAETTTETEPVAEVSTGAHARVESEDEPEPNAAEAAEPASKLENVTLVPLSNGRPDRFALSALGRYARRPKRLYRADDLDRVTYKPLEFRVLDASQTTLLSGLVVSSIGVAATAHVLHELESNKAQQRLRPRWRLANLALKPIRSVHRAFLTLRTLWKAPQFHGEIYHGNPDAGAYQTTINDQLEHRLTGIELISNRQSRFGRAQVDIDDTRQQLVFFDYEPGPRRRATSLKRTLGRLATGKHDPEQTLDLTDKPLSIHIGFGNGQVVPFHVDGIVGVLEPGQTLQIKQTDLSIPVLVRRQKARHKVGKLSTRRSRIERQPKHSSSSPRPDDTGSAPQSDNPETPPPPTGKHHQ